MYLIYVYTDFTQEYRTELEYIKLKIAKNFAYGVLHQSLQYSFWVLGFGDYR